MNSEIHIIEVKGVVQGVGFRPFVYNLAIKYKLLGYVKNDENGVFIELQGDKSKIKEFKKELEKSPPSLSKIQTINYKIKQSSKIYEEFSIVKSNSKKAKTTFVSSDISVCSDCLDDISNINNHRYNYALTNCTNCGPRYTIIENIPYDRVNTSMREFKLCEVCQTEYEDPTNRRYHAQPICCPNCGPKIELFENSKVLIKTDIEAIQTVANIIKSGEIIAIKSLGGYHLVCDATNSNAVKTLRERKNRPTKPFAVMCKDIEQINIIGELSQKEKDIVNSKERPITIVKKRDEKYISPLIAPNIGVVGVFLPFTPLQYLLFKYLDVPIVATSANLKGEPIIASFDELYEKLKNIFSYCLSYNRDIINSCDDSVVQVVNDKIFFLRKARGYAPSFLKLTQKSDKKILAVGANQKNTISIMFDDIVVTSPHIGDLDSIKSMYFFEKTLQNLKRIYEFEPDLIVCDKHPNYESTKWAIMQNLPIVKVQHHYAHILSVMAQYDLKGNFLCFAFDGTGYGDDGNIWGGEVFVASNKEYKRVMHFEYFRLLGGERSIKEINRLGLSLLFDIFSIEEILKLGNSCVKSFSIEQINKLYIMWKKGLNSPFTSSIGRVFDAVCSLSGLNHSVNYDGESGLLIENAYNNSCDEFYNYEIIDGKISLRKSIREIVKDKNYELIPTKFINTLYEIILEIIKLYPNMEIILCGGVFQNKTLLQKVTRKLDSENRKYYCSEDIPLNDAGISLGQIYSQIV